MLGLITPASYWVLSILWLTILALYLGKLRHETAAGGAVALLLTLLSIDAFRTLFESVYFGLYFNSMFGLLPSAIHTTLSKPGLLIIPKLINVLAGIIVLTVLIRRWVPNEIKAREDRIVQLEETNKKLSESEARFRTLMEKIPVALVYLSKNNKNIFRNESFVKIFGYTEELVPTVEEWWRRAYPDPAYRDEVMRVWEQAVERSAIEQKNIEALEVRITCRNGEQRIVEASGIVLGDDVLVTFIDLTAQKRNQKKLEKARAEAEAIFNCIVDGIVFVDPQRRIMKINPAFSQMFGYQLEEIVGQTTKLIYADPEQYGKQGQVRFNPTAKVDRPVFENEYRSKDGTTFTGDTIGVHVLDESENLLGYIAVIHDVTERKQAEQARQKLEEQLRQKYKMEAMGVMAGGMAHNFNNNLSIVLGNLELLRGEIKDQEEEINLLNNALVGVNRSRELIEQVMAFSRIGEYNKEPVDLRQVVDEAQRLLQATIPSSVELSYHLDISSPLNITVSATHVQEILFNLCNNAVSAMDEKGVLSIKLNKETLTSDDIPPSYPDCQPGAFVCLTVSDTGCGIRQDLFEKIFDPFFTTKAVNVGTGMGLSSVHGYLSDSGGMIKVESRLGVGSTFYLYFPLIDEVSQELELPAEVEDCRGNERIMLVDDDPMIARLNQRIFAEAGYQVTVETDSKVALELFRNNPDAFDMVITDQTMPALNGDELLAQMLEIRPDLATIICTGFSSRIDNKKVAAYGIDKLLLKPVSQEEILAAARGIFDQYNLLNNAEK